MAIRPIPQTDRPEINPPPRTRRKYKGKRVGPNWKDDGTYYVGRNQPPPEHQFKPGHKGFGRRKGTKKKANIDGLVSELMEQSITLTNPQGKKITMTQATALLRKIYEKAVKGDLKAAQFLFERWGHAIERKSSNEASEDGLTAAEEQILKSLFDGLGFGEGEPS